MTAVALILLESATRRRTCARSGSLRSAGPPQGGLVRRVALIGTISLLFAWVPLSARAGGNTSVSGDCRHAQVKPPSIVLVCADDNWYVQHLRWRSWGMLRAFGAGIFHFNDCIPNCASGTFHRRRGELVLRSRHWCRVAHVWVFSVAAITYDRPWHGQTKFTAGLPCPLVGAILAFRGYRPAPS
jgi:hypothetical protein